MDSLRSDSPNDKLLCGIYSIINRTNGYRYIGSSIYIPKRWQDHLSYLARGAHPNIHLQRAYNHHGREALTCEIVELVQDDSTLIEREQFYIDTLHPEYNLCPTAGSSAGRPTSEETRKKLSAIKSLPRKPPSIETRLRISQALAGKVYGPLSEEHRRKLSKAHTGQVFSEDARRKMSEAKKGKTGRVQSEEERRKKSETMKTSERALAHQARLAEARARGEVSPPPIQTRNSEKVALAQQMWTSQSYSITEICATIGISRATLYRYVKETESTDESSPWK